MFIFIDHLYFTLTEQCKQVQEQNLYDYDNIRESFKKYSVDFW